MNPLTPPSLAFTAINSIQRVELIGWVNCSESGSLRSFVIQSFVLSVPFTERKSNELISWHHSLRLRFFIHSLHSFINSSFVASTARAALIPFVSITRRTDRLFVRHLLSRQFYSIIIKIDLTKIDWRSIKYCYNIPEIKNF